MNIPEITGTMEFKGYNHIVNRIKKFEDYEIIGQDASEEYDLYAIHLGDVEKPTIFIIASIHGSEWKSTHYSLDFFEKIRDNSYPDKEFRDYFLNNYHILYVPVVNPYGFDLPYEIPPNTPGSSPMKDGRNNFNDVNLNRDFKDISQPETQAIVDLGNEYKPFSFLSCHLTPKKPPSLEIHSADDRLNGIKRMFMDEWSSFTGESVLDHKHPGFDNPTIDYPYFSSLSNDYTPYNLSFLTEIGQWEITNQGNSLEDVYYYGMSSLFIFFNITNVFFKQHNGNGETSNGEYVTKIEQEHKTIYFNRNTNNFVNKVTEEFKNGNVITTTIERDGRNRVTSFERVLTKND